MEITYNPAGNRTQVKRYRQAGGTPSADTLSTTVNLLHDYGQRSYEPTLGRFLNRDPIGVAGGANVYGYLGGTAFGAWDAWGWEASGANSDFAVPVPGSIRGEVNGIRYVISLTPESTPSPPPPPPPPMPPKPEQAAFQNSSLAGITGPNSAMQLIQLRLRMFSNSGVGARDPDPPRKRSSPEREKLLDLYIQNAASSNTEINWQPEYANSTITGRRVRLGTPIAGHGFPGNSEFHKGIGDFLVAVPGVFIEPYDWVLTGSEICQNPSSITSYAGLIP